ncbi:uncharacterized protein G2W53_021060 [Senna tora]|uniref:Uncharacterized protein n=1 Tax=Senna tora TaxID=362788 RepID=A0A834TKW4_9FABA|nr:uncharacterized protein G2W53_021060 [Senna tora]
MLLRRRGDLGSMLGSAGESLSRTVLAFKSGPDVYIEIHANLDARTLFHIRQIPSRIIVTEWLTTISSAFLAPFKSVEGSQQELLQTQRMTNLSKQLVPVIWPPA